MKSHLKTFSILAGVAISFAQDQPLITTMYTADPSAHVYNGKLFLYPSHDVDGTPPNAEGDHFAMKDYHVFSMDAITGPVTDHGIALALEDVPWASRQLWAPDVAYKNGQYFLYFPARDKDNLFRTGVAVSEKPSGPFTPDENFIPNTFSIDPASYVDTDGAAYLMWGGLHGGQLQCWQNKTLYNASWAGQQEPTAPGAYALSPQIAKLSDDMHSLAEPVRDMIILSPETRAPILASDKARRFFEGAWMHKRGDTYYLTYSTGTTHYLVYATGDNPYGPFTYRGRILEPVAGWTTHASIVEYQDHWYLFYHDSEESGKDWLRQVKVKEIWYGADGEILLSP